MRPPRTPFAARAGRWSARHRAAAIGLWLTFVIAAFAIGNVVGMVNPKDDGGTGESGTAEKVLDEGFPKDETTETVLVQAPAGKTVRDASVRAAIDDVVATARRHPRVTEVKSPLDPAQADEISADRRSALVQITLRGDEDANADAADALVAATHRIAAAHPGVFVGEFGDASASNAISKAFSDDFAKAEKLSLPISLIILVLAFGSLVAAGVPLLLAISAVMAALGLVSVASHVIPMDESVSSVVLLIGMAVGVDYALFYLRREREERRRGRSTLEAVEIASATSGRAVIVSGLTVIAAMAGMFLAGDSTFTSLGVGSILVVFVAMIGSVTVVPAMLAALGDKVDRGRIPFLARRRRSGEPSRAWSAVLGASLRRPVVSAVLAAGLLIVLAIPAFSMHTTIPGTNELPRSLEVMRTYDRMQAAFPGGQIPATVVVAADDVTAPQVQRGIAQLRREALASGRFHTPVSAEVSADRHVASIDLPMDGDGADAASVTALDRLRDGIVPQTIGKVQGTQAYVTGMTAGTQDFNSLMKARAPLVVAFVLALAFLLLLVVFRSLVIPVTAIALNLLSVGAAYGVLTWVFQEGHLQGLLGFTSDGAVTSWLPMFLFVVLFGLSMDYHVFILSRIREAVDDGERTEDAVRHGILSTAGTVTSAAAVMVAVFAIFATLGQLEFKQMGVGLAVAILLDATVVRAILLPSVMKLLGERNWYLPHRLGWLPRVSWEGPRRPARRAQPANG